MKINIDKIANIYVSIIGASVATHSIYNMGNAPFKYKQDCIDTYKYKNYKHDSNEKKPEVNRFIDKPNNFDISMYVIEGLCLGICKGAWMGVFFPITIPSSIYYMKVKSDLAELEKVKPS
jgi:hypothetical protein